MGKIKIDRSAIDAVLGKTNNRLDFENEVCSLFGYKKYHEAPSKTRKLIGEVQFLVLKQEIKAIELALGYANEKNGY